MVEIALVFVGFVIFVHVLLFGGAVYLIPRVLEEPVHESDEDADRGSGSGGRAG